MSNTSEGYVTIPVNEYIRLLETEKDHKSLLNEIENHEKTVVIGHYGYNSIFADRFWVKNPSQLVINLESRVKTLEEHIDKISEKQLPFINLKKRKVRDLE